MYILHVLYNVHITILQIRQGSQRAVCMWDKYNMDIVQNNLFFYLRLPTTLILLKWVETYSDQNWDKVSKIMCSK